MACWPTPNCFEVSAIASISSSIRITLYAGFCSRRSQHSSYYPNYMKVRLKDSLPWRVGFATYVIGLGLVGYWPVPVDRPVYGTLTAVLNYIHAHGAPPWVDYHFVEGSANVAIFIPFGFLAFLALYPIAWWRICGLGLLVSACMELGQLLLLTARFSSIIDIVTNTIGTVIGVGFARILTRTASLDGVRAIDFEPRPTRCTLKP